MLFSRRSDQNWERFLSLLIPFNQGWVKDASALLFIVSDTMSVGPNGPRPFYSHSFDAGAAWAQMGLQAVMLGYHAHAMTGIDFERIPVELAIPHSFRVEAAVAIGRKADASTLPEELRSKEIPSDRKPIHQIAHGGNFIA